MNCLKSMINRKSFKVVSERHIICRGTKIKGQISGKKPWKL